MAPFDIDTVLAWRGRTVRDSSGEKIGSFGDVFLESDSDVPAWGGIKTGLFGRHESFVPLRDVRESDDEVLVPFTADEVKAAPRVDPDVALTPEEEDALYTHYGYGPATSTGPDVGATAPAGQVTDTRTTDAPVADAPMASTGPQVHDGAAEVTRSEEEVRLAGTERRATERVRLRKVLVTEHVQKTVPVRKEVVQLETDPPPANAVEIDDDDERRP